MALRGDQRALLQLICERGQSYEDISGLLGVSVADARRQAREALAEIGGADPDAEVGLTDYLLGQADPIGRADAARYLQSDPEALALAARIEEGLREIAPGADLPKLPEPRGKRARAATPGRGEEPGPTAPGDSKRPVASRQGRMIAVIAAAGVILIVAILAIAGVFSGDDSDSNTSDASASSGDTTSTTSDAESNITTVKLSPVSGSGVGGSAKFGLVNQSQLYVDLDVSGLPPAEKDSIDLVWLMVGEAGGYPINDPTNSPIVPDENGNYSGRIAVPTAVAVTIGNQATAVRISSSPISDVAAAAKQASKAKNQTPILPFIGTNLAAGDIPLANDASTGGSGAGKGG
jgi:hypothetical protein